MVDVIAHRGASAHAPEHTLAAYDLALALGADRLELDVRPLADGTPVVVHDRTLARTCGDPRAVRDLAPEDLEALEPGRRPLLLEAVLRRYGPRTRVLVDLKEPEAGDGPRVLELAGALGLRGRVAVQSFDHGAVRALRVLDEGVELAPLYPPRLPARLVRTDLLRTSRWASAIAPCSTSIDQALVAAAHSRGLRVHAYTVNAAADATRLAALGVDGLITDVPDRIRAVLAAPAVAA